MKSTIVYPRLAGIFDEKSFLLSGTWECAVNSESGHAVWVEIDCHSPESLLPSEYPVRINFTLCQ